VVSVMGGLAGCVGSIVIGPRVGVFYPDRKLSYILDDEKYLQEQKNLRDNAKDNNRS